MTLLMSIVQAPPGCAQWFNSRTGNISSFNLQDGEYQVHCTYTTHTTYSVQLQAGLNMVSCLAREPSSCAVKFKLRQMQVDSE